MQKKVKEAHSVDLEPLLQRACVSSKDLDNCNRLAKLQFRISS